MVRPQRGGPVVERRGDISAVLGSEVVPGEVQCAGTFTVRTVTSDGIRGVWRVKAWEAAQPSKQGEEREGVRLGETRNRSGG